jgi:hypothetical protein
MLHDTGWASYLDARRAALGCCAGADAMALGAAERRLQTYLGMDAGEARRQARRCALFASDAAFHDQLVASGRIDVLRTAIEEVAMEPHVIPPGGAVAVSLHYGPATSILPLCLAKANRAAGKPPLAVIQNSHRNPAVMLPTRRTAELAERGFPMIDLDITRLGEIGALRRALATLSEGGMVLIFADGQLPGPNARRSIACRLGAGPLSLAHGAAWLAQTAGVHLLPFLVRPTRDGHRVEALPRERAEDAPRAYQALIDAVATFDPAPWSRWCCGAEHF